MAANSAVSAQPSGETGARPQPARRGPNQGFLPISGVMRTAGLSRATAGAAKATVSPSPAHRPLAARLAARSLPPVASPPRRHRPRCHPSRRLAAPSPEQPRLALAPPRRATNKSLASPLGRLFGAITRFRCVLGRNLPSTATRTAKRAENRPHVALIVHLQPLRARSWPSARCAQPLVVRWQPPIGPCQRLLIVPQGGARLHPLASGQEAHPCVPGRPRIASAVDRGRPARPEPVCKLTPEQASVPTVRRKCREPGKYP